MKTKIFTGLLLYFLLFGNPVSSLLANNPAGRHTPELGSMGGFYTLSEISAQLDSMRQIYPHLISLKDTVVMTKPWLPKSPKRPVWIVKISENPDIDENEPRALFIALIHANEPMSMMQMIFFMWDILEKHAYDEDVRFLLKTRELYFIPVLNPDGYAYNQKISPNGYGPWKLNRQGTARGAVVGFDINRNFGYAYVPDFELAHEYFRGFIPFQANEAAGLGLLVQNKTFTLNINYHGIGRNRYPGFVIYPWNYDGLAQTPDSSLFRELSRHLSGTLRYRTGKTYQYSFEMNPNNDRSYPTGTIEDWMYGSQQVMSLSVGIAVGLWPKPELIAPTAEKLKDLNYRAAWSAGCYPVIRQAEYRNQNNDPYVDPGETAEMTVYLENKGLASTGVPVSLTLSSQDTFVTVQQAHSAVGVIPAHETLNNSDNPFVIDVSPSARNGQLNLLTLTLNIGGNTISRNIEFYIGTSVTLLQDTFQNTDNWINTGGWGLSPFSASGTYSLTESPNGLYKNNTIYSIINKTPLRLSNIVSPFLEFSAYWKIEPVYDFACVSISTDQGRSWNNLAGYWGNYASGEPPVQSDINLYGYDGEPDGWINERISLKEYSGADSAYIKFELMTDGWIVDDGFYLDNIKISGYPFDPGSFMPNQFFILNRNYPNPFNPSTEIRFTINRSASVSLAIYNVLGQKVAQLLTKRHYEPGHYHVVWNGRNSRSQAVSSGVYFYRLEANGKSETKKMMLIR